MSDDKFPAQRASTGTVHSGPVRALPAIEEAIEASRRILELQDDWDGEGSTAYTKATWQRATDFVIRHAEWLRERLGVTVEAPEILPGPDGSIDVHWETDDYELLVNVPADSSQPASFFGDDYGTMVIKGTLDPKAVNRGLLVWLANLQ